jgi:hypothetical protein
MADADVATGAIPVAKYTYTVSGTTSTPTTKPRINVFNRISFFLGESIQAGWAKGSGADQQATHPFAFFAASFVILAIVISRTPGGTT